MARVSIDDPASMNLLGLFLAAGLRRGLAGRERPPALRGALAVHAGGMRATVRFEEDGVTVTRAADPARVTIEGPLDLLLEALVHRRLRALLRIRVRGSRLFALRAMGMLRP